MLHTDAWYLKIAFSSSLAKKVINNWNENDAWKYLYNYILTVIHPRIWTVSVKSTQHWTWYNEHLLSAIQIASRAIILAHVPTAWTMKGNIYMPTTFHLQEILLSVSLLTERLFRMWARSIIMLSNWIYNAISIVLYRWSDLLPIYSFWCHVLLLQPTT